MRIASRVIGIALALAGVAFFVVSFFIVTSGFDRKSVLVDTRPDRTEWITGALSAAFGVGFILAGRYYLKLNVHELDQVQERPASRLAPYFIKSRRALKIIAQAGLVISLIRLAAACFGVNLTGAWAAWPLVVALVSLAFIEGKIAKNQTGDHLDWRSVPDWLRSPLKILLKAGGAAFLILALVFGWNAWFQPNVSTPIVQAGLLALFFAWESLFFEYGDISADQTQRTR